MSNTDLHATVESIKRQFLCCVPVKNIEWNDIFSLLTWENQEFFANNTVDLQLVLDLPVKISYQKAFVKHVIEELEKTKTDINDCLYHAYARLVSLLERPSHYKHYYIDCGKIITLKENHNIISEGTTGLCTWQASLALAEWCLENKSCLEKKCVVELGSGIGLTGLVAALDCNLSKYYFTDCHKSVLKVLRNNVILNLEPIDYDTYESTEGNIGSILKGRLSTGTEVEVLNLPWEKVSENATELADAELILAADVVFDSSLFLSLGNALYNILNNGVCKRAVLACTERNEDTLGEFLCVLGNIKLAFQELRVPPQKHLLWSTESPIRIFEITNRKDEC